VVRTFALKVHCGFCGIVFTNDDAHEAMVRHIMKLHTQDIIDMHTYETKVCAHGSYQHVSPEVDI